MNIGAQLRSSREAKGLSIDALAHTTRVQPRILAAIERNDVSAVPPRPFGRGFVRAYAREIGLDPEQTARDYFAQFAPVTATAGASTPRPIPREPAISSRGWTLAAIGGTSGAGAAAASDTHVAARPGDVKTPAATAPKPAHALSVVLRTTGRCWV